MIDTAYQLLQRSQPCATVCELASVVTMRPYNHRRRLLGAARARAPPIIRMGVKTPFLPPNNQKRIF